MPAGALTRDSGASEQSSMIAMASHATDSTTPTEYTLDLSALPSPPSVEDGFTPRTSAPAPQRSRKRSRGASASHPPPHAQQVEKLGSDEVDGPEDFTINMEYWMRCNLPDAPNPPQEIRPVEDATLNESMDSWMSRGSEKLVAMHRQRVDEDGPNASRAAAVPEPEATTQEGESDTDVTGPAGPQQTTQAPTEESEIARKLAQVLGVPSLPSAPHLDRMISAREAKLKDLEDMLELARKENSALELEFRKEKKRLLANAAQLRDELAAQRAETEERVELLKREAQQSAAELIDAREELVMATEEAESAREELRLRDETSRAEMREVKERFASDGASDRDSMKTDADFDALTTEIDELKRQGRTQQRNLLKLSKTTLEEIAKMQSNSDRAMRKLGKKLDQQRTLTTQLQEENEGLEEEVEELRERLRVAEFDGSHDQRSQPRKASEPSGQSSAASSNELEKLRAELDLQIRAADAARREARAARDEAEQARAEMQSMNERMDARIAAAIWQREREWAGKVSGLKSEKKNLSRALMRSWGEVECGKERPQKYHYHFVEGV